MFQYAKSDTKKVIVACQLTSSKQELNLILVRKGLLEVCVNLTSGILQRVAAKPAATAAFYNAERGCIRPAKSSGAAATRAQLSHTKVLLWKVLSKH
jgi:hypothetical protein